jgi:hypothetical protein
MTQNQIDRLRECKRKASEINSELFNIWEELQIYEPLLSEQNTIDTKIVNTIGVSASDLLNAFNRHNKII